MFASLRCRLGLCLLLLLFLLVVGLVDPIRETAFDDDFAYSLTVRHLLQTGEYRLHDWAAANMPVQIYWAAGLAKIFGYSFTTLRFSTLILLFFGLIAFYQLLRDFGRNDTEASLLSLALLASPIVQYLGFTFFTDVQFLSWLMIAFWLYTRALQKHDYGWMMLASVAAAAAIGTRQFGVALVAGLAATWLLLERQRLRTAPLYLAGMVLPLLMTLWQLGFGLSRPTFSQAVRLQEQSEYIHQGLFPLLIEIFLWRLPLALEYLGLFLLPLLPLCVLLVREAEGAKDPARAPEPPGGQGLSRRRSGLLIFWSVYIAAGVCYAYLARGALMPSVPWMIQRMLPLSGPVISIPLTLLTGAFAVLLGWLLSFRYFSRHSWQTMPRPEGFLVLTSLALLGLQLSYVQFGDEYFLVLLPFAVFVLGRPSRAWPRWCRAVTAALCLVMLLAMSLRTRGNLELEEAYWRAAETVRSTGVAPRHMAAPWPWLSYYSAFDEWVAEVQGQDKVDIYNFFNFLGRRRNNAEYALLKSPPDSNDPKWRVLGSIGYRDTWLRKRYIYIAKKAE